MPRAAEKPRDALGVRQLPLVEVKWVIAPKGLCCVTQPSLLKRTEKGLKKESRKGRRVEIELIHTVILKVVMEPHRCLFG
jgi:hypothetical protein